MLVTKDWHRCTQVRNLFRKQRFRVGDVSYAFWILVPNNYYSWCLNPQTAASTKRAPPLALTPVMNGGQPADRHRQSEFPRNWFYDQVCCYLHIGRPFHKCQCSVPALSFVCLRIYEGTDAIRRPQSALFMQWRVKSVMYLYVSMPQRPQLFMFVIGSFMLFWN